jgi:hypothetical protein
MILVTDVNGDPLLEKILFGGGLRNLPEFTKVCFEHCMINVVR